MTAVVDRDALVAVLKKAGQEVAPKIPGDRAKLRLERLLAREPNALASVKLSKAESLALESLEVPRQELASSEPAEAEGVKGKVAAEAAPEKKGPRLKPPVGVIELMRKLLAQGETREVVLKAGRRRYTKAGFTDAGEVSRRLELCLTFAGQNDEGDVAKKHKGDDEEKASKKKGKTVVTDEGDDEEEAAPKGKKGKPSKEEKAASKEKQKAKEKKAFKKSVKEAKAGKKGKKGKAKAEKDEEE